MTKTLKLTEAGEDLAPDCLKCEYYYITWDKKFPYGCRALHFKSKRLPQWDVLESSGEACELFKYKHRVSKSRLK